MAIQPIDYQVAAALKAGRVKVATLTDGQTILTWAPCPEDPSKTALYQGDVVRCDECPNVSTINGRFISSFDGVLELAKQHPFALGQYLIGPDEIGCYDSDGSGDVLCPDCSSKRKAA